MKKLTSKVAATAKSTTVVYTSLRWRSMNQHNAGLHVIPKNTLPWFTRFLLLLPNTGNLSVNVQKRAAIMDSEV